MIASLDRLQTALADRYAIRQELGHGGMAVVYLADDLRHHRPVAIKVLRPELAAALGSERFLREIEIAARLTHPHILPVHDSGEIEGLLFYVMPLVEGESLRERLNREGALPVGDAVRVAREVADALAYAHAHNVVHRDVKPENVLLGAGHAIVSDFGIARAVGMAGERITATGLALGTPAYMAPEQAMGVEAVDARADIYSLGCVAYEMLAGRPPFIGATVIQQHLSVEPAPIAEVRPEVPAEVAHAVTRALRKSRDERFATAADFRDALERRGASLAGMPAARRRPPRSPSRSRRALLGVAALLVVAGSGYAIANLAPRRDRPESVQRVVVLPFQNLGDPKDQYFADGITEEITARLAGIPGIGVISRTSALQYKNTLKRPQEIARELGVDYVLEGTIRWQRSAGGDRVRITPQLIRVQDDTHLWAQVYDEDLREVFAVQSDVAGNVASALGIALGRAPAAARAAPTRSLEAYDNYLRALDYRSRGYVQREWLIAEQLLERAVELDPGFALAHAALSRTHADLYWFHYDRTPARAERVRRQVERATELAPDLLEARLAVAYYHYYVRFDLDRAVAQFEAIRRQYPNSADALQGMGFVYRRQGRLEDALRVLDESRRIDPRTPRLIFNIGETSALLRRYDRAAREYRQVIALAPWFGTAYRYAALAELCRAADTREARAILDGAEKVAALTQDPLIVWTQAYVHTLEGNFERAIQRLRATPSTVFEEQFYFVPKSLALARLYDYAGRRAEARAYYDSAHVMLEGRLRGDSTDSRIHSALGIALAGLGRRDEALAAAQRGVDLMPTTKDAYRGTFRLEDLASVRAMLGDAEGASAILERLLAAPAHISPVLLRADPRWASLRGYPRFHQLAKGA